MEKNIEVINGDGKDLEISPVYDHLNSAKPSTKKDKKEIVIPQEKKK